MNEPLVKPVKFGELPPDRLNSTYYYRLHLTNGKIFDGYSKKENRNEAQDKRYLLTSMIQRLATGYFHKMYYWEWFRRECINGRVVDTLVLEMTPQQFQLHDFMKLDLVVDNFLKDLYPLLQQGIGPDSTKSLVPDRKATRDQEKEDFSFERSRFRTEDELVAHCRQLIKWYPRIRVEHYWIKYKELFFQANRLEIRDPETARNAVAVQTAVTKLSNGFNVNKR